jgi:hypothetical protein
MARFFAIGALLVAAISFAPTRAFADPPDEVGKGSGPAARPPERSWLYLEEPQLADPLHAVVGSRVSYASSASTTSGASTTLEAGGELGLLPGLALTATGLTASESQVGALAGARLSLLPRAWRTTRAVASGGYARELTGANGTWVRLAVSQDVGPLRLATTVHGEHVFAAGHDAADITAMLGANVRVASFLRAGAEYVAQDLEGAVDREEAEQGVRHFLGPSASFALLDEKLTIAGGPAFGLSAISPRVLGRVAVAYSF